jgi:hypothetical protein
MNSIKIASGGTEKDIWKRKEFLNSLTEELPSNKPTNADNTPKAYSPNQMPDDTMTLKAKLKT